MCIVNLSIFFLPGSVFLQDYILPPSCKIWLTSFLFFSFFLLSLCAPFLFVANMRKCNFSIYTLHYLVLQKQDHKLGWIEKKIDKLTIYIFLYRILWGFQQWMLSNHISWGEKVMDKNVACGIFLQNGKNWKCQYLSSI